MHKDDRDRQSEQQKIEASAVQKRAPESEAAVDQSKRKFAKTGLLAAPAILTLANKPAWAGYRCTLSGQLSGNLSHPDANEVCGGEGCSPGYWKNHVDSWHPDLPPSMLFETVFNVGAFPGNTLLEIAAVETDNSFRGTPAPGCFFTRPQEESHYHNMLRQLGFHAVAGLQNAATSVSYDLTVEEVIASFRNAYLSCDVYLMEEAKTTLDFLNNQYCPLN